MRFALNDLCDNHSGKSAGDFLFFRYRINLDSDGSHCISYLLRREVALKIVFKPTVRKFHIYNR